MEGRESSNGAHQRCSKCKLRIKKENADQEIRNPKRLMGEICEKMGHS